MVFPLNLFLFEQLGVENPHLNCHQSHLEVTQVNTLEKREAAASKGAAILDLVQRYREKARP